MIHIVIPEGLNKAGIEGQPLSDYFEACLRRLAGIASHGETVYLAPGNAFGHPCPEDQIAADFLRQLRPDLLTRCCEATRGGYLDTLDNAVCLREWARLCNCWPMTDCWLYCNRYHVLRTWLCFRIAGFRVCRIVACAPEIRRGSITPRLKYYDYAVANVLYEALAIGYTFLRLAGNYLSTGSLLPVREVTH